MPFVAKVLEACADSKVMYEAVCVCVCVSVSVCVNMQYRFLIMHEYFILHYYSMHVNCTLSFFMFINV